MTANDVTQLDGFAWKQPRSILFNGVEIPVEIEPEQGEGDDAKMSAVQIEALRLALSLSPDVLETSAPAVVQNYEVYREMIGDDDDLPPLGNPVEVWQSVAPSYILIPSHEGIATPSFLLFAECDWDPEHGLVVRFRDGIADASGQQGELAIND